MINTSSNINPTNIENFNKDCKSICESQADWTSKAIQIILEAKKFDHVEFLSQTFICQYEGQNQPIFETISKIVLQMFAGNKVNYDELDAYLDFTLSSKKDLTPNHFFEFIKAHGSHPRIKDPEIVSKINQFFIEALDLSKKDDSSNCAYQITKVYSEKELIQLAFLICDKNKKILAFCLGYFKIKDQPVNMKLATACAESGIIANNLSSFNIRNEDFRAYLLRRNAIIAPEQTMQYFDKRYFTLPENIVSVLLQCANFLPGHEQFEIMTRHAPENVAILVKQLASSVYFRFVIENFSHFNLPLEKDRLEIAKICFLQNMGNLTYSTFNLSFEGQLDLATYLAGQDRIKYPKIPKGSADDLKFAIKKLCAARKPPKRRFEFPELSIKGSDKATELAKIYIQHNGPKGVGKLLDNITNDDTLRELAILSANIDGRNAARIYYRFNLKNDERFGFIRLCAINTPRTILSLERFYGNLTEAQYIDLAVIIGQKDIDILARNINHLGIQNPEFLNLVAKAYLACFTATPYTLSKLKIQDMALTIKVLDQLIAYNHPRTYTFSYTDFIDTLSFLNQKKKL